MIDLDSILKSRDITLLTKVHLVKAMVFPVVMYGYESWTINKDGHQKIDAFELWCWSRLLRVLWTARRSNQLILKKSVLNIHQKDWCWSWSAKTLATSYGEPTHWKRSSCGETLKVGEEGVTEDKMVEWHHRLDGHELEQALEDDDWQGNLACCSPCGCKESDMTERLNWTELNLRDI